jgi:hypothetical protein
MSAEATKRGRASRRKGQVAERQVAALIADLTGWTIKRRVRQHAGDSDLEGVPGWCVEVKDRAKPARGAIAAWWKQAVEQTPEGLVPVLFFKAGPGDWRAVWPADDGPFDRWTWLYTFALESSVECWAAHARQKVEATQASPEAQKRAVEAVCEPEAVCES